MEQTTTQHRIRRAEDRFHSNHGWLDARHTFSFAGHYDPAHTSYQSLRVLNDDRVAPLMGFGEHPHRDMEIITYVISGQLRHQDSMGNGRTIQAGEFQYMSAGSGVQHSEFNPSSDDEVHLLQIWITPEEKGLTPRYAELKPELGTSGFTFVASPDGRGDSLAIRQQAELHHGRLAEGETHTPETAYDHHWLHLISGELQVGSDTLRPGDAIAIDGPVPELRATADAELLLFSLAPSH